MKFKIIKDILHWNSTIIVHKGTIVDLKHDLSSGDFVFYHKGICYRFSKQNILQYVKKLQKRAPLPLP